MRRYQWRRQSMISKLVSASNAEMSLAQKVKKTWSEKLFKSMQLLLIKIPSNLLMKTSSRSRHDANNSLPIGFNSPPLCCHCCAVVLDSCLLVFVLRLKILLGLRCFTNRPWKFYYTWIWPIQSWLTKRAQTVFLRCACCWFEMKQVERFAEKKKAQRVKLEPPSSFPIEKFADSLRRGRDGVREWAIEWNRHAMVISRRAMLVMQIFLFLSPIRTVPMASHIQ